MSRLYLLFGLLACLLAVFTTNLGVSFLLLIFITLVLVQERESLESRLLFLGALKLALILLLIIQALVVVVLQGQMSLGFYLFVVFVAGWNFYFRPILLRASQKTIKKNLEQKAQKKGLKIIYHLGLLLIVLFAFYLRIWQLGEHNLWGDEGYFTLAARGILTSGVPVLPSGIVYPRSIFFAYALAPFASFAGNDELILRLISVFAGVGTVVVSFYLVKKYAGVKYALLVALLLALSPVLIETSRYIRHYSLSGLLILLVIFLVLKWQDKLSWSKWLIVTFLATLSYFTDPFAVLIVMLLTLSYLAHWQKNFHYQLKWLSLIIVNSGVYLGSILIDRWFYYNHYKKLIAGSDSGRDNLLNIDFKFKPLTYLNLLVERFEPLAFPLLIAFLGILFWGFNFLKLRKPIFKKLVLFSILLPLCLLILSMVIPKFETRYFSLFVILLIIVSTLALYWLKSYWKVASNNRFLATLPQTFLVLLLVGSVARGFSEGYQIAKPFGVVEASKYLPSITLDLAEDLEGAAAIINAQKRQDDVTLSLTRATFNSYLEEDLDFLRYTARTERSLKSIPLPLYRQKADYFGALRVTNGKTLTNASKLIATGLQEEEILVDPVTGGIIIDRDLPELIEILLSQYERVWLYAARFEANPAYIDPVESEFLEQNSAAVVYEGRDGVSKVYLLE